MLRYAAAGALATLIATLAIDGAVARALVGMPAPWRASVQSGMRLVEVLFAFPLSPYLYGAVLVAAGVAARVCARPSVAASLWFVGLSHLAGRFLVDLLKPPFSRVRPFEAMTASGWHDVWFAAVGNSFPSGHAAHFWSLYFPLVVLCPRQRWPLAVLPLCVSAARVAVNDHYVSDVLGSATVAAAVTYVCARVVLGRAPSGHSSGPRSGP